jgi:hypothetical protein
MTDDCVIIDVAARRLGPTRDEVAGDRREWRARAASASRSIRLSADTSVVKKRLNRQPRSEVTRLDCDPPWLVGDLSSSARRSMPLNGMNCGVLGFALSRAIATRNPRSSGWPRVGALSPVAGQRARAVTSAGTVCALDGPRRDGGGWRWRAVAALGAVVAQADPQGESAHPRHELPSRGRSASRRRGLSPMRLTPIVCARLPPEQCRGAGDVRRAGAVDQARCEADRDRASLDGGTGRSADPRRLPTSRRAREVGRPRRCRGRVGMGRGCAGGSCAPRSRARSVVHPRVHG